MFHLRRFWRQATVIAVARRALGTVVTSCAMVAFAAALIPSAAAASLLDTTHCDNAALTQPFTPWWDVNYYKLAPGADFEGSLGGWSLQGGAHQTAGSESFDVTGTPGSYSLSLPAGAVATSPQTCVNAAYPDFRLFTRTDTPGASVVVSVVYGGSTIPVGVVTPGADWQPTLPMLTGSAIAGALNGGTAYVSLRFAAVAGSVQIDDAYVDPSGRCC
jgi:hypothetical protein